MDGFGLLTLLAVVIGLVGGLCPVYRYKGWKKPQERVQRGQSMDLKKRNDWGLSRATDCDVRK